VELALVGTVNSDGRLGEVAAADFMTSRPSPPLLDFWTGGGGVTADAVFLTDFGAAGGVTSVGTAGAEEAGADDSGLTGACSCCSTGGLGDATANEATTFAAAAFVSLTEERRLVVVGTALLMASSGSDPEPFSTGELSLESSPSLRVRLELLALDFLSFLDFFFLFLTDFKPLSEEYPSADDLSFFFFFFLVGELVGSSDAAAAAAASGSDFLVLFLDLDRLGAESLPAFRSSPREEEVFFRAPALFLLLDLLDLLTVVVVGAAPTGLEES